MIGVVGGIGLGKIIVVEWLVERVGFERVVFLWLDLYYVD